MKTVASSRRAFAGTRVSLPCCPPSPRVPTGPARGPDADSCSTRPLRLKMFQGLQGHSPRNVEKRPFAQLVPTDATSRRVGPLRCTSNSPHIAEPERSSHSPGLMDVNTKRTSRQCLPLDASILTQTAFGKKQTNNSVTCPSFPLRLCSSRTEARAKFPSADRWAP
jgi:hypothetical protein